MKTKNFIWAILMLGISSLSYAQGAYPPINRSSSIGNDKISQPTDSQREYLDNDSIVKKQTLARIDSSADSIHSSAIKTSKTDSAVSKIAVIKPVAPESVHKNEISGNQRLGMYGACLFVTLLIFVSLFFWIRKKSLFKRGNQIERLQAEIAATKLKEEKKTLRSNAKVDRKKYALEELGEAAGQVITKDGSEKPGWKDHKEVMRFIAFLLEGKWFLRWNPKPFLWLTGSLTAAGLVIFLVIASIKQPGEKMAMVKTEAPEPAITPTVVPIEVPEPIIKPEDKPISYQKPKTVDNARINETADNTFYVEAPAGRYGPTVYIPTGYYYEFWPEDDVYGLPNPNNLNSTEVPFKDGPEIRQVIKRSFKSVAWASRVGHDTRVKVIKKWIGNGNG